MNLSSVLTSHYENVQLHSRGQNKPNQTQFQTRRHRSVVRRKTPGILVVCILGAGKVTIAMRREVLYNPMNKARQNIQGHIMEIEQILKKFREGVERLYGERLKNIILYGSWARGKATQDSDIDLAIVLDGDVVAGRERGCRKS